MSADQSRFDDIDNAICRAIKDGKYSAGRVLSAVESLATPLLASKSDIRMRVVDRRLQSLRRRGLIAYEGGRWYVTDALEAKPQETK